MGQVLTVESVLPKPLWYEENGIIYLSNPIISDGTTGLEWVDRLVSVSDDAKGALKSENFKSTSGVVRKIAILRGSLLFKDKDRSTRNLRIEARHLDFSTPNAEDACYIREEIPDEEVSNMDFQSIVVMHKPIIDSVRDPMYLVVHSRRSRLRAFCNKPFQVWVGGLGFAFEVKSKN